MISAWARDLFETIDRMDAQGFAAAFTEEGRFRFANQPVVRGRVAIAEAVQAFFGTIAGVRHELQNQWTGASSLALEGRVTYTRHDGTQVTLPFADIIELREHKVTDYRIYIDVTPLYQAPQVPPR